MGPGHVESASIEAVRGPGPAGSARFRPDTEAVRRLARASVPAGSRGPAALDNALEAETIPRGPRGRPLRLRSPENNRESSHPLAPRLVVRGAGVGPRILAHERQSDMPRCRAKGPE